MRNRYRYSRRPKTHHSPLKPDILSQGENKMRSPGTLSRKLHKLSLGWSVITALVILLVWNEYLSHVASSWFWPQFTLYNTDDPSEQIRVLFVADPQLIGYRFETKYVGPITRWDSDRYLRNTYQRAFSYHQPHAVAFLGDLLDEGSSASAEEYEAHMQRFFSIYPDIPGVKYVYIPGDNDVGGEGFDLKEEWKVSNFNKHFLKDQYPPKDVVPVHFVDMFRLNIGRGEIFATEIQRKLEAMLSESSSPYRVLCNHESIVTRYSNDQNNIIATTKANMIFTAHIHRSELYNCSDCRSEAQSPRTRKMFKSLTRPIVGSTILQLDMNNPVNLYEIVVPTTSYRMGVAEMGIGAAVFDRSGHVQYSVLWQPGRYPQLFVYAGFLVLVVLVYLCLLGYKCVAFVYNLKFQSQRNAKYHV